MAVARILLADDEPDLVWSVQHYLAANDFHVTVAKDGLEALTVARQCHPDLVILDIMMPRLDGLQVCQVLRNDPSLADVLILFLTGKGSVEERLAGLDSGGDDYLVKPFDVRELFSRVKTLLRRAHSSGRTHFRTLVVGPLTLDADTRHVQVKEKTVLLTPTEWKLLYHLASHAGKVFSQTELLQQAWGYPLEAASLGLVRWYIKKLREKIEPDPDHPIYIRTLPHHGYALVASESGGPRGATQTLLFA